MIVRELIGGPVDTCVSDLSLAKAAQLVGVISIKDVLWALTDQRAELGGPK